MKKSVFSLILALVMVISAFSACFFTVTAEETSAATAVTPDTTWYDANADSSTIEDAADLLGFSKLLAEGTTFAGKTVKLNADIDLNPGWDASTGEAPTNLWSDTTGKEFAGVFDGQGNTVSGIYLAGTGDYTSLFGSVKTGTAEAPVSVKNLAILNSYVTTTGDQYNAALFASTEAGANVHVSIENVYLDLDISISTAGSKITSGTGGFIGYVQNSSVVTIKNCVFAGNITLAKDLRNIGSMVGYINGNSEVTTSVTLTSCGFYGTIVTGGNNVGGLVGRKLKATLEITDCIAAGDVTPVNWVTDKKYQGSIIAYNQKDTVTTITNTLYIDSYYWVKNSEGVKEKTPFDIPYGYEDTANTIPPTMTNSTHTTRWALMGDAAKDLIANMTEWTVTTGFPLPKTLAANTDIVPPAVAPGEQPPVEEEPFKMTNIFDAKTFQASTNYVLNYEIYVPEDYDASKKYPVILFLHGEDARGNDNESQLNEGICEPFKNAESAIYDFIVVAPQCPADKKWVNVENWTDCEYSVDTIAESDELKAVLELMASLKTEYSVDTDCIYATGLSMGGYATWDLIVRHPELFTAVVPVCGGADSSKAELIKAVPIWAFHGGKDTVVPPTGTAKMVNALDAAGNLDLTYSYMASGEHDIWSTVYANEKVYEWMLKYKLSERRVYEDKTDVTTEPVTDPVDTDGNTSAQETESNTTPPATDPAPSDSGSGCASTVGALSLILVIGGAAMLVAKKKEN